MKADPVAPRGFGFVHRPIRPLEDVVLAGLMVEEHDDADTRRALMRYDKRGGVLPSDIEHEGLDQGGSNYFYFNLGL